MYMGFFTYSDFLSRGRYRDKGIIVNIVTTVEGFCEHKMRMNSNRLTVQFPFFKTALMPLFIQSFNTLDNFQIVS